MIEYDSGNESDDSDVKHTLLYTLDLHTEIVHSFGNFMRNNTFEVQQFRTTLSPRLELILNEVLQQL